jgi:hypothetical protein
MKHLRAEASTPHSRERRGTDAPAAPQIPDIQSGNLVASNQPLRFQARPFIDVAGGVYDFRARFWSPETATFLEPEGTDI